MSIAYFDCFAGISGDMCLGALIDAGAPQEELVSGLKTLKVPGWHLRVSKVSKNGISASKVDVEMASAGHRERRLPEILKIIAKAELPGSAKELASRTFQRLAEAEAKVHGVPVEKVHFHEVGAVDAIVDVVGTALALELLGIDHVISSRLPSFHGFALTAHGTFPLPAPATLELVKGIPMSERDVEGELVTPTGAAIITTSAESFGPMPSMKVSSVGYGAGAADYDFPNALRVVIGEESRPGEMDEVRVVETNIDDLNPEFYEVIMGRLFGEGALDVYLTPVQMKKTRPGTLVTVISPPAAVDRIAEVLFRESSTIGVRVTEARRLCPERKVEEIETRYGMIRMKVSERRGRVRNAAPEYEDCRAAAAAYGVPIKEVYAAAIAAFEAARSAR